MSMSMRGPPQPPVQQPPASPSSHKRPRPPDLHDPLNQPPADDPFHHEDGEDGDDDDEEDGGSGPKPKNDKKAGRRKIKIEFIQDKSRRHITFSKRKAGIMKKVRFFFLALTHFRVFLLFVRFGPRSNNVFVIC
jgi:pheromone receptor transcription factor